MNQQDVKVPYEEVAAYYESMGVETYTISSGSSQTTLFTISWDTGGFTGKGWALDNPNSPLYGWAQDHKIWGTEEATQKLTDDQVSDLIEKWASSAPFENKINWLWSLDNGCAR